MYIRMYSLAAKISISMQNLVLLELHSSERCLYIRVSFQCMACARTQNKYIYSLLRSDVDKERKFIIIPAHASWICKSAKLWKFFIIIMHGCAAVEFEVEEEYVVDKSTSPMCEPVILLFH